MNPNPLTTRTALLWVLTSGPGFGTELAMRIRALGFAIRCGSLYPGLRELEHLALVSAWEEKRPGRPRRYYRLTKEGRRVATRSQERIRAALDALEATGAP